MITLFEQQLRYEDRQSSKGNQLKWEKDGIWYKADYTGYEGLAEYMVSHLLQKSSLSARELVLYDLEQIQYKASVYNGASSQNFVEDGWQIITLERLYQSYTGKSLTSMLWKLEDVSERIYFLKQEVERITGLSEFGVYLNKLFTIDAFFLNEDRHLHNIAVMMDKQGRFMYCPLFDHGASLLSDTTMDYPMGPDVYQLMHEVQAKPCSMNFDEQLDLSEEMFGENLKLQFTKKDVFELLEKADFYAENVKKRVEVVLLEQMRKYGYLFQR